MNQARNQELKLKFPKGQRKIFKPSLPLSFQKSLLQKAVRLSQSEVAMKVGKMFIKTDEKQFIRRWLVIQAEDSLINEGFGKVATILRENKFPLTKGQKEMLVNLVGTVAGSEWRDNWVDEDEGVVETAEEQEALENRWKNEKRLEELTKAEQQILLGIKYRASVGGGKGDITMLWNYYCIWLNRFLNKDWSVKKLEQYFIPVRRKFGRITKLKKEDIILSSADMHCTPLLKILVRKPWILTIVRKQYPKTNQENLEQVLNGIIWRQMSSVNVKKSWEDGKVRDWYVKGQGKNWNREKDEAIYKSLEAEIKSIAQWSINQAFKV